MMPQKVRRRIALAEQGRSVWIKGSSVHGHPGTRSFDGNVTAAHLPLVVLSMRVVRSTIEQNV
jgi:hypothetical protein